MKRIVVAAVVAGLFIPALVSAQSNAEIIERALAAAPARGRDETTVIRWNSDHTYETIKEGTNRIVCYDRSGEDGRPAFAVQCTSLANLDRLAQTRKFEADTEDRDGMRAMVDGAEADGTRVLPEFGSAWLTMNGPDMASARLHRTIAMPGATTATTGFPENGRSGGAWIMAAGTSTAHLMIPGT